MASKSVERFKQSAGMLQNSNNKTTDWSRYGEMCTNRRNCSRYKSDSV